MRTIKLIVLTIILASCFSQTANACLTDAPAVGEKDVLHPPENMLAVKAEIIKVKAEGPVEVKPHVDFIIDLLILDTYSAEKSDPYISVSFGGCHNMPGSVGDKIFVLALKNSAGDWYAPQFWNR